ncbi:MAG: hypothetical protein ACLFU4_08530, partial [Opitutales bacterium]
RVFSCGHVLFNRFEAFEEERKRQKGYASMLMRARSIQRGKAPDDWQELARFLAGAEFGR